MPIYPSDEQNKKKIPAAYLIEKAGWKGKRIGAVATHENQALVVVNHGGATGKEIVDFANQIIEDIDKKFAVKIQMEVNKW